MHDRVVLDEEMAWKLFGAKDVSGLQVTIAGSPYLVAGVWLSGRRISPTEGLFPRSRHVYVL
jgi:hypothetical protein